MLNAINTIAAASGVAQRTKAAIRRRVIAAAIAAVGAVVICAALGFIVAAAYMWLTITLPDYVAALCVAGALLAVGMVPMTIACQRPRAAPVIPSNVNAASDAAGDALNSVSTTAATYVRKHPTATLLSVVALGVVVGLVRANSTDRHTAD